MTPSDSLYSLAQALPAEPTSAMLNEKGPDRIRFGELDGAVPYQTAEANMAVVNRDKQHVTRWTRVKRLAGDLVNTENHR